VKIENGQNPAKQDRRMKQNRNENEETHHLLIPDSHKCICESGLSGQRHGRNGLDVDEMQTLQAVDVLNVRRRIARRSISPQITIPIMPLADQVKKADKTV
jgi:hypothetical protein